MACSLNIAPPSRRKVVSFSLAIQHSHLHLFVGGKQVMEACSNTTETRLRGNNITDSLVVTGFGPAHSMEINFRYDLTKKPKVCTRQTHLHNS